MADFDQKDQSVDSQQNADTITIHNYNPEQYEQYKADLAEKEKEIRGLLIDADRSDRDKEDLYKQLAQIEQLRLDELASYMAHVKDLQERIARLDQLSGQVPDKLIKEARQALVDGDHAKADQLFTQIEEQADPHILAAAESAYQRGKLAEDNFNYREAFQHYERAVQLAPNNQEYLPVAGIMAGIVVKHQKQIEWNEKALEIYLEQEGEDSADVASLRNNLGEAWIALGEYEKAVGFFELALASGLKTYGEDHPDVAIRRNNLGEVWRTLGEYEKAIGLYELALASNLKTYGEDHPDVAIRRNNLGSALEALGEYEKAIGLYELALATFENRLDVDHPSTKTVAENLASAREALKKQK